MSRLPTSEALAQCHTRQQAVSGSGRPRGQAQGSTLSCVWSKVLEWPERWPRVDYSFGAFGTKAVRYRVGAVMGTLNVARANTST